MKRTLTLLLLFSGLLPATLYAQQITGKVIDCTTAEPLPFANIVIVDPNQSATLTGTVTDMDGNFALPSDTEKKTIRISYLGYQSKDTIAVKGSFNTIPLSPDDNMLSEVVIKGTRKNFKMENGGIAMDIANSPLKDIGTANDVIEKLPFVVKNGDELTVLDKGTPIIYINNRLIRNPDELEKLSSANIKKVTVITNPGPEYDASVSAVIRIEAIRPPGQGLGGDVFGRVDFRRKTSYAGATNLNYRINNLDIFGYYGYSDSRRKIDNYSEQELITKRQTTKMYSDGVQRHHSENHYIDGGFNYDFNSQHSMGAKYSFTYMPNSCAYMDFPSDVYIDNQLAEKLETNSLFDSDARSHLLNAYYAGEWAEWLKMQLDFDYARGNNDSQLNSLANREKEEKVSTQSLQNYDLYAGKLTLNTPLWGSELTYGAEFSNTKNEQEYIVNEKEGAEDLESNTNLAKQNLFAVFAGYSKAIDKWTINLGIRFENANFDYLENGNKIDEQSRTYRDWFPSASVNYQSENIGMTLSYRSTIVRPGYYQLRNDMQYNDPYTYETGNPYLNSTKINDISYSLLWRDIKFMTSYKMYNNMTLFVPQQYQDTDILLYRPENAGHSQIASISAYYTPKIGIWQPTAGVGVSKDFLSYGETVKLKYNKPYVFYSLQNVFRLPAGILLSADLKGNSRGHRYQWYEYNQMQVDMRVSKAFLNDKLVLNFIGRDILGTYRQKEKLDVLSAFSLMDKKLDTRSFQFSVRYKFNATRSKYKGESASEGERSRL